MAKTHKKEKMEEKDLPGFHRSRQKSMDLGARLARYEDSVLREQDLLAMQDMMKQDFSEREPCPELVAKLKELLKGD